MWRHNHSSSIIEEADVKAKERTWHCESRVNALSASPNDCKEQLNIDTDLTELYISSLLQSDFASHKKFKPSPKSRLERNYNEKEMEDGLEGRRGHLSAWFNRLQFF